METNINPQKKIKNIQYYKEIFEKYQKYIYYFVIVLIVIIGSQYYYKNFYLPSLEVDASEQLYGSVQEYFKKDSLKLALDGDGQNFGFNEIISEYSGTKSANIATYYAGLSEYKLGNYQKAIDRFNSFETDENVSKSIVKSLIGDSYSELKDYESALEHYQDAFYTCKEKNLKSMFLFKAHQVAMKLKKMDLSLEYLEKIKSNFKNTYYGKDIDKYISMVKFYSK